MSDTYSEYAVNARGGLLSILGMKKEYEVIFLDGTLEISAIYNKSRRKRKFLADMKNVTGYHLGRKEDAVRLGKITKDFSSGESGRTCCVMKIADEKRTHVVCFEPGDELTGILERRYRTLKV